MSSTILALILWMHLLATVIWIGGLATLTLLLWPSLLAKSSDNRETLTRVLDTIEKRFRPYANVSLAVLLVTGMIQMSSSPYYEGLLKIVNVWSIAMLVKHVIFGVMILNSVFMQMFVLPDLDRARMMNQSGKRIDGASELQLRERLKLLMQIDLIAGVIVLLMTAIMTAQ